MRNCPQIGPQIMSSQTQIRPQGGEKWLKVNVVGGGMRPNTVVASWSLSFYEHFNYYIKNVMLNFMVLIY